MSTHAETDHHGPIPPSRALVAPPSPERLTLDELIAETERWFITTEQFFEAARDGDEREAESVGAIFCAHFRELRRRFDPLATQLLADVADALEAGDVGRLVGVAATFAAMPLELRRWVLTRLRCDDDGMLTMVDFDPEAIFTIASQLADDIKNGGRV